MDNEWMKQFDDLTNLTNSMICVIFFIACSIR